MDELLRTLLTYLRGIWHGRWLGLAVAWAVAIAGAVAVSRIPDKYEASARVYVDTESVLRPLLSGLAVQPDLNQQLQILSRTLISRPNIEKLMRMSDLDLGATDDVGKSAIVDQLVKNVSIASVGRDNLYTLSYRDSSPERAKKVVQSLVSIFVDSSLGDKRRDTDQAKRFIDDQIRIYEKKLEEAENRLKEFKLRNLAAIGPEGQDFFSRVGTLTEDLNSARLELRAAEQSRDALKRELAGEEPVFLLDDDAATTAARTPLPEIDVRIAGLKKQLDELRRQYTDEHPDVVGTKRVIAQLEEEKKEELATRAQASQGKKGGPINLNTNPVYQQLKVSLAEAEANVASLSARVRELEARFDRMRQASRMQPQLEAELSQLNRDYDVQKRQYESLVARRESASLSGDLDSAGGGADFRLIDPPRATDKPVTPNRALLLPLVLLGSLASGILASFVLSQMRPVFHDSRSLREVAGRPVLGSVTLLPSPQIVAQSRRNAIAFGAGLLALVVLYSGWLTWVGLHATRTAA
jgi:polysaccharide chain length determinant protein (PEP-CTERM system associated)